MASQDRNFIPYWDTIGYLALWSSDNCLSSVAGEGLVYISRIYITARALNRLKNLLIIQTCHASTDTQQVHQCNVQDQRIVL